MTCCSPADSFFDAAWALRDLRRYQRRGPLSSCRKLLKRLGDVSGLTVMDVGGGVGAVTHSVLAGGAARVTAVDASAAYLDALQAEAARLGHADLVHVRHGDFTVLAKSLDAVDVLTMDRVLCCYEDLELLLTRAASRTRRRIGLVYPRDTLISRLAIRIFNALLRLRRHSFRVYFHAPERVAELLTDAQFTPLQSETTLLWQIAVYERK